MELLALKEHLQTGISEEDKQIREVRRHLYRSYALTRLHFKPNDPNFTSIEKDYDLAFETVRALTRISDGENSSALRESERQKVKQLSDQITAAGRELIKSEWEIVKRGEDAYELTKKWSIFFGGIALTIIFILGAAAAGAWATEKRTNTADQPKEVYLGGPAEPKIISNINPTITIEAPAYPSENKTKTHTEPTRRLAPKGDCKADIESDMPPK